MVVKLEDVKRHPFVDAFVAQADANLAALGYTEHGKRHVGLVSSIRVIYCLTLIIRNEQLSWQLLLAIFTISAIQSAVFIMAR